MLLRVNIGGWASFPKYRSDDDMVFFRQGIGSRRRQRTAGISFLSESLALKGIFSIDLTRFVLFGGATEIGPTALYCSALQLTTAPIFMV